VPYIEKQNGNLWAKSGNYKEATTSYNKSLFALKMVFDKESDLVQTEA
jgi:hypothetical protein